MNSPLRPFLVVILTVFSLVQLAQAQADERVLCGGLLRISPTDSGTSLFGPHSTPKRHRITSHANFRLN